MRNLFGISILCCLPSQLNSLYEKKHACRNLFSSVALLLQLFLLYYNEKFTTLVKPRINWAFQMLNFNQVWQALQYSTLREETFADRNFRVFAFFGPIRESLCPRNFLIITIRESLCLRKFSENLFAKFFVQELIIRWISIPEIQKLHGFMFYSCFSQC